MTQRAMTKDELGRRTMQGCGIMTELIKFDSHCLLPLIALGFLCSKIKPWLSRKNTFGIFLHQVMHGVETMHGHTHKDGIAIFKRRNA